MNEPTTIAPAKRIANVRASVDFLRQIGAPPEDVAAAEAHLDELLARYRRGELEPLPDDGTPFSWLAPDSAKPQAPCL